jgi:hypothetical protein
MTLRIKEIILRTTAVYHFPEISTTRRVETHFAGKLLPFNVITVLVMLLVLSTPVVMICTLVIHSLVSTGISFGVFVISTVSRQKGTMRV